MVIASSTLSMAREGIVLDLDEARGLLGGLLVDRGDGGDRVADEADDVEAERVLVLRDGEDAEGRREGVAGEHGDHAGEGGGAARVHAHDARVGAGRAVELGVEHARAARGRRRSGSRR